MIQTKRKGISTFIATLLLMVLAVAAGIVIYAYTMGYLGGFGGTETLGSMTMDTGQIWSNGTAKMYIRNTGKVNLNVTLAYIAGSQFLVYDADALAVPAAKGYVLINQGAIVPVYLNQAATYFTAGNTYSIKLVCADNTQLSVSIKAN
jgi:hypothetical protein